MCGFNRDYVLLFNLESSGVREPHRRLHVQFTIAELCFIL